MGFDWAVLDRAANSGTGRPAKVLQKIVGAKKVDAIGPKTLQAVANFDASESIEKPHSSRQKFH